MHARLTTKLLQKAGVEKSGPPSSCQPSFLSREVPTELCVLFPTFPLNIGCTRAKARSFCLTVNLSLSWILFLITSSSVSFLDYFLTKTN